MTTTDTKINKSPGSFRLPDPPEREPDDMTSAEHLSETGLQHHLKQFLGNPETTIVSGEKYLSASRGDDMKYPDLLVAFDVDPSAYRNANGYLISEQGKPPDLVLEIASGATGHVDIGDKREFYESLGIPEYWRFDATGEFHGARLAGDRLVEGRYQAIEITEVSSGALQGHSDVLNLDWRWEDGQLGCHDPATGQHIATFDSEREARTAAETRAVAAEARATSAETELRAEREARAQDQARIDELEAQLRRLNS